MKAGIHEFEVIGVTHDGETVCRDCLTKLEEKVFNDELEIDDINPVFASEGSNADCDRCGCPLLC